MVKTPDKNNGDEDLVNRRDALKIGIASMLLPSININTPIPPFAGFSAANSQFLRDLYFVLQTDEVTSTKGWMPDKEIHVIVKKIAEKILQEKDIPHDVRRITEQVIDLSVDKRRLLSQSHRIGDLLRRAVPDIHRACVEEWINEISAPMKMMEAAERTSTVQENPKKKHSASIGHHIHAPLLSSDTMQVIEDINNVTGPLQATGRESFQDRLLNKKVTILSRI